MDPRPCNSQIKVTASKVYPWTCKIRCKCNLNTLILRISMGLYPSTASTSTKIPKADLAPQQSDPPTRSPMNPNSTDTIPIRAMITTSNHSMRRDTLDTPVTKLYPRSRI